MTAALSRWPCVDGGAPAGFDVDVLIAGAGPVGLTLATDLRLRGISTLSVETRAYGEPPSVKSNHVAARSMEIFRRLGSAGRIRDAGLPPHYPVDVVFRTTMTGTELSRIPIPSREERFRARDCPDGHWPTAEPPHRINQIYLEPILLRYAVETCGIALRRHCGRGKSGLAVGVAFARVGRHGDTRRVSARATANHPAGFAGRDGACSQGDFGAPSRSVDD